MSMKKVLSSLGLHGVTLSVAFVLLIVSVAPLYAATATIGGNIFTGQRVNGAPDYTTAPALNNAKVMVQNQHSGGEFIAYGTVNGNSWSATVPAPGDYIVMFSAPNHDATSREFMVIADDNVSKDAYLPPLPLPNANLLVYTFYDNYVNGEDDFPDDPGLGGVTLSVRDEDGNLLATGISGQSPILPDGAGPDQSGLYYFTNLPPGEVFVCADTTTVGLHNPAYASGTEFYHMTSEEGGRCWEVVLYPGDPGTEAGAYLVWFGFVEKLGQLPYHPLGGKVIGTLIDADMANLTPAEPWPVPGEDHPGVTPNTMVPEGFAVLVTNQETVPVRPVATAEADANGVFQFNNVTPGAYKIFASDLPIDYVWGQQQINVLPGQSQGVSILLPRFYGRINGYVIDQSTGSPVAGATVHVRYKDGSIQMQRLTDASGWYNFDDMPEIEVIGSVDVKLPAGYQGARVIDTFYPNGKENPQTAIQVESNGSNRYVQWYTANYRADLLIEPVPSASGTIDGFAFSDALALGTWGGDGVYDPHEERTLPGLTVNLYDAASQLVATTTTGELNEADHLVQGWHKPYTMPPDEWGGVFDGPLTGYFEFRDLAPGEYSLEILPAPGFFASPVQSQLVVVTVSAGGRRRVNFGMSTLVPLAGEIEGGVFDDVNIDYFATSLLFGEKAGIPQVPVGVYDHLGYLLGAGAMGNPMCYEGAPAGQCPSDQEQIQKPEMERRFAPGVHIYMGNDPSFEGYNPNYLPLALSYNFGQGKYKFEADWSLVPTAFGGLGGGALLGNAQIIPNNAPVINNVVPVGSYLISGSNFGAQQGNSTVTLAGQDLHVKSWSDTEIHVDDPVIPISGAMIVTTSTGISNAFQVTIVPVGRWAKYLAARTVYVNSAAADGNATFGTIAEALNNLPNARPRYVLVAPGYYNERIRISESDVYLIGAGPRETIIDAHPGELDLATQGFFNGRGPAVTIGKGGETGSVSNIMVSGFTITGATVDSHEKGAGVFGDYGNRKLNINNNIIVRNGGYYGGGIWLHYSNHDVRIWSNLIAENGNFGGYGGGISVNDEPEYGDEHGEPEHIWDDHLHGSPPGTYQVYNNLIHHNYSPDYGGGLCFYEVKDRLEIFGNMIVENKSEDHGGGLFFEDTGPIEFHGNVVMRNYCADDGGAISFEDVGDDTAIIEIYNNLFAENIADDRAENHARGGALAFDDTFYASVYNNTIVGNIVAGSANPAGGAIDSERNGHEYNGEGGPYLAPGYSDPKVYNNIIWGNWRLEYERPLSMAGEDIDYTMGVNFVWTPDQIHVDNPALQDEWERHLNSESLSFVRFNDIFGGEYLGKPGNFEADPRFADILSFDWRLLSNSPAIDRTSVSSAPRNDLDGNYRRPRRGKVDIGAYEFMSGSMAVRIPEGIIGEIYIP